MMDTLLAVLHSSVYAIPAFIFLITMVVFFHELGHFSVARFFNTRVETFSIGFGPAIVKWTESVGVTLTFRDRTRMELRTPSGSTLAYDVLEIFPFTSESKRMGIVVRDTASGELTFLQKGADVVMARIVQRDDWLEEETANMAREGLRTLVVARR